MNHVGFKMNEFIKDQSKERVTTIVEVNSKGEIKKGKNGELVVAKIFTTTEGEDKRVKYQIPAFRGSLFDPYGEYSGREDSVVNFLKFVNVSEDTYDNYITYLRERKRKYYNQVNRSFMND